MFLDDLIGSDFKGISHLEVKNVRHRIHRPLAIFRENPGSIDSLCFSQCGKYVFAGSDKKFIRMINIYTKEVVWTLRYRLASNLCFSGKFLAFGDHSGNIKILDCNHKTLFRTITWGSIISTCDYSPCGKFLAAGGDTSNIKIWEIANKSLCIILEGHTHNVTDIRFSPHGKFIASGSHDTTIIIWGTKNHRLLHTLVGHSDSVCTVCWNHNEQKVFSGSYDKTIKIWEVGTGNLLRTLIGHSAWVSSICYDQNERHLISASFDHTCKAWNIDTGNIIINFIHLDKVKKVCCNPYSPYKNIIASGSSDKTIKIWKFARKINYQEMEKLLFALGINVGVTRLDLSTISLRLKNVETLCTILNKNPNIVSVNLRKTDITGTKCAAKIKTLASLLRTNTSLKYLTLSCNELNCDHVILMTEEISDESSLVELDFSGNRICYQGALSVIKAATRCESLRIINLQNNTICIEDIELGNFLYCIKEQSKLQHVNILYNSIGGTSIHSITKNDDDEVTGYFQPRKPRIKPVKQLILANSCKNGVFFPRNKKFALLSYLNSKLIIDRDNWVAAIARRKNKEHAVLFIEGIRSFGQRFIQRAHFVTGNGSSGGRIDFSTKKGLVETGFFNIDRFNPDDFIIKSWMVKRNPNAKKLQSDIMNDVRCPPKYRQLDSKITKMFQSNSEEIFNCFTWAKARVESAGFSRTGEKIVVDQSWVDQFFPNTSRVLKKQDESANSACNVM